MKEIKVRFPLDESFEDIAADYRRAVANRDEKACEAARIALGLHAAPFIGPKNCGKARDLIRVYKVAEPEEENDAQGD